MTYEEPYFKDSTISNYKDYTEKRFDVLCNDLIALGIQRQDTVVDFGCAVGGLIAEFRKRGYQSVCGTDVSWWAIQEGRRLYGLDHLTLQHLNYSLLETPSDWMLALDVFEHIGTEELKNILKIAKCKRLIFRVPVSAKEGEPYVLRVSRNDKTHIQCHAKEWWLDLLSPWFTFGQFISGNSIYNSEGVLAALCVQSA